MSVDTTTVVTKRPTLWRNRDFMVLWSGQLVSTLGSRTSTTALPLLVLALTGSPADAGIVGAAGTLPFLLSLPAGVLVDRWNRKWILLVSELVAGLALAGIPIALWLSALTVTQLALTAFVQGCCAAFFGLAETAALPQIVPASQLAAAVAQNEGKSRGASLVGPPLGGLLFGLGRVLPFVIDAVTYLISAAGLLLIRRELQGERRSTKRSFLRETAEGLAWLWRQPFARAAVLLIAASNLVFQALVLILVVLVRDHGAASGEIGLMLGIYGGGGLLGALLAGRLQPYLRAKTVIIGANWIWAGLLVLMLTNHNPILLGLIGGASAFVGPLWNVVMISYQLTIVPEHLMGRVGSAVMTLVGGVMPVGSLAAGYLLVSVGPVRAIAVLAAFMCATAVVATVNPAIRNLPAGELSSTERTTRLRDMSNSSEALVRAFAPTGRLRASINLGNPILAHRDPVTGETGGVSVDLARALGRELGLEVELILFEKAVLSVDAVRAEQADVGFFAVDPARSEGLRFSAPYVLIEGSYLVPKDSALRNNAEVDRPGAHVAVGQGSAYDLFLSRDLQAAQVKRLANAPAVLQAVRAGRIEVAAGIRQLLESWAEQDGSLRVLPGHFMVIQQAMGLPAGRGDAAAEALAEFVERMKSTGFVAEALARHGIEGASVAPST
ncbi:MAG TPA: MFS transporter [Mycobacteriales bacterium]|jgi:ABC-type amino acid transport substrate-binding protein|nr:MFS transporter [Mycobacteriales bacterium]